MKKSDYSIIYDAYQRYLEIVKCKNKKKLPLRKQYTVRKDLQERIDRVSFHLGSDATLLSERERLVNKGKVIYQQYSECFKENPEVITVELENKMKHLLEQLALSETEFVRQFRITEPGGEKLNLESIFTDDSVVKKLIHQRIRTVLEQTLSDQAFTIVSQSDQDLYITSTGKKYHTEKCPYCRGKQLIAISLRKIDNLGLTPCKCMEHADKVLEQELAATKEVLPKSRKTMTAFIDESVRNNPWKKWDDTLENKQGSYSYIICKGYLHSENEICPENTWASSAAMLTEIHDTNFAAIEAISTVLMKIAFGCDFHDDVVIYTDNSGAKDKWYKKKANHYLSKLFNSVTVKAIPRTENKIADQIGRDRAFANIPSAVMQDIMKSCNDYDLISK